MADENDVVPLAAGEQPGISDAELRTAFAGPAVAANRIYITTTSLGLRIAFAEQNGEKVAPAFRTAIVLSFQDAISMKDLLTRLLADVERQIADQTAKDDGNG